MMHRASRLRRRRGTLAVFPPALVCMTLIAAGCDDAASPEPGRVAITPPALYDTWWAEVEACSGTRGSMSGLSWFVTYRFRDGADILGQWNGRREITLRSDVWLERLVVSHEILHDLLRGDAAHSDPSWEACGLRIDIER